MFPNICEARFPRGIRTKYVAPFMVLHNILAHSINLLSTLIRELVTVEKDRIQTVILLIASACEFILSMNIEPRVADCKRHGTDRTGAASYYYVNLTAHGPNV